MLRSTADPPLPPLQSPRLLGQRLPWMDAIVRPQRKPRLPVVLSVDEAVRRWPMLDGRCASPSYFAREPAAAYKLAPA